MNMVCFFVVFFCIKTVDQNILWQNQILFSGTLQRTFVRGIDTLSREATQSNSFISFWKGVYSEMKEFAPKFMKRGLLKKERIYSQRSKFFPFRADPFSEGDWGAGKQTRCHKSYLPCQKWQKFYPLKIIITIKAPWFPSREKIKFHTHSLLLILVFPSEQFYLLFYDLG